MTQYDDTNRGALFKNADKESENHPDYKGRVNAAGVDYWVSAWIKKSSSGIPYMSLSIKPKEDKPAPKATRKQDDGDSIPF